MQVFISWSGDLSRELGETLRDWLPGVLQSVKPFFTPNDIEKGSRWGKDIANELGSSSVGIFCLTKENLTKPWLMFEAGALSKNLDASRVCPILFGVETTDLEGPLLQFQAAPFTKTEIKKLIKTINSCLGEQKLDETVLNNVFDMWWPRLEEKVTEVMARHNQTPEAESLRGDRELLEEILELSRLNASRARVRSGNISPTALEDLVASISATYSSIQEGGRRGEALDALSKVMRPLRYLIRQRDLPRSLREELLEKLEEMEFSSSDDGDDET
jgi:hypothetical protein